MAAAAVLAARISRAARVSILTGAGVSAASGVPTFRGAEGLWRQFRPEELATQAAFMRDPQLVWEWYAWRREAVAACRPNPAHEVIAKWSRERRCTVLTQNVDDLHVAAGTRDLVRLHGSLWELRCAGVALEDSKVRRAAGAGCGHEWRDERVPLEHMPPRCPRCDALARPAIVWFGEALRDLDIAVAIAATGCDVFVTIGTSALVHPAAGLVHAARRRGAYTAEINVESTSASADVDLALQGRAEELLPELDLLLSR
jgi:NAD-dependent deacetylase